MAKSYFQQKFEKYIDKHSGEWLYKATGNLGRSIDNGKTIETGTPGIVWVRTTNGQEVTAYNRIAPSIWDTHLVLGISKSLPNIWQVIEVREPYAQPASSFVLSHAAQHLLTGTDTVFPDRKQILSMTILVSDSTNFTVRVFGGIVKANTVDWTLVTNTGSSTNPDIGLSSYIPSEGAVYVTIEHDIDGVLYVHAGTPFESKDLATVADIPTPVAGRYPIGCIVLYESMEALLNEHITVFAPAITDYNSLDLGTLIHTATVTTTLNNDDEIGIWNSITLTGARMLWSNIVATLMTIFNDVYQPLGSSLPLEHIHGIERWNGASGQDTFDCIDIVNYIESVTINGLEEDPFVYSLSSDGTQLIFDTPLASDSLVLAHTHVEVLS